VYLLYLPYKLNSVEVTSIAVSPSGKQLFVAQCKGVVDVLPHASTVEQDSSIVQGSFIDTKVHAEQLLLEENCCLIQSTLLVT